MMELPWGKEEEEEEREEKKREENMRLTNGSN
jgi:hypothetical protein